MELISCNDIDFTGIIKKCLWRGKPVSCAAIFKMQPTDRGMCCSFNKEKAEKMFKEGRYQEHLMKMTAQDENMSMGGSRLPEWLAWPFYLLNYGDMTHYCMCIAYTNGTQTYSDQVLPLYWGMGNGKLDQIRSWLSTILSHIQYVHGQCPVHSVLFRLYWSHMIDVWYTFYYFRFDTAPEAGKSWGLDLVLDAHTDLVTASSVTEPFQVIISDHFISFY